MVKDTTISKKTITKRGFCFAEITPYGLACGYIQKVENASGTRRLVLSKESTVYHVKYSDTDRVAKANSLSFTTLYYSEWRAYDSLSDARKAFNELLDTMATYYDILGMYEGKWEVVTCEPSRSMALAAKRTYQGNEPGISFTIEKIRGN